jgi:hypothetical protein
MARKLTCREWTLMVLVAGVGVIALWIRDPEFTLGRQAPNRGVEPLDLGAPPVVELAKLEPLDESYDVSGRNLFEYYTPPPPPRPKVERPKPTPRPIQRPTPQPPQPQPSAQAQQAARRAQPPRISFKYLGYLGPHTNKIAVFEDGDEVFIARAGEVVRDQFRVIEFQHEKLVMGYTDERFANETTELDQKKSKRRR